MFVLFLSDGLTLDGRHLRHGPKLVPLCPERLVTEWRTDVAVFLLSLSYSIKKLFHLD